jgi:hypothetical protein
VVFLWNSIQRSANQVEKERRVRVALWRAGLSNTETPALESPLPSWKTASPLNVTSGPVRPIRYSRGYPKFIRYRSNGITTRPPSLQTHVLGSLIFGSTVDLSMLSWHGYIDFDSSIFSSPISDRSINAKRCLRSYHAQKTTAIAINKPSRATVFMPPSPSNNSKS